MSWLNAQASIGANLEHESESRSNTLRLQEQVPIFYVFNFVKKWCLEEQQNWIYVCVKWVQDHQRCKRASLLEKLFHSLLK